ncbi:unnamed protein product [Bursaphelenchus okinawaensis]|uniref:Uncharacterized protein n=1 Tax=Bursaphelenchus okinawaensis TaxID=465554 RepID=A0A811K1Z7_9BILA|nr:unnamed protein product [Bursaphelenchus okinawaensis]CAG9089497.1 unnamed protein product [Bursaphelenchus okinawaensis]
MAFYFALFNVSNVNNELRGQRKERRDKRRHSLASSNCLSTAKDYRLLPKPQIVFQHTDDDALNAVSSESLNHRRSSSRDSGLARSARESRSARLSSHQDQLARELKKVHFRPNKMKKSKERLDVDGAEEPIWMRRQTVDLSDSYPSYTDSSKRVSEPWVYSIDLDENQPETERKSRSQSLSHSESWSPASPISDQTNSNVSNNTLLSSPKQTWLASSETLTESTTSQGDQVWQKPVMGVNALEDWDNNDEVEKPEEQLKDELQTHINTWPEMNAKKKIRWRPTSLIRRHSESDQGQKKPHITKTTSTFRRSVELTSPEIQITSPRDNYDDNGNSTTQNYNGPKNSINGTGGAISTNIVVNGTAGTNSTKIGVNGTNMLSISTKTTLNGTAFEKPTVRQKTTVSGIPVDDVYTDNIIGQQLTMLARIEKTKPISIDKKAGLKLRQAKPMQYLGHSYSNQTIRIIDDKDDYGNMTGFNGHSNGAKFDKQHDNSLYSGPHIKVLPNGTSGTTGTNGTTWVKNTTSTTGIEMPGHSTSFNSNRLKNEDEGQIWINSRSISFDQSVLGLNHLDPNFFETTGNSNFDQYEDYQSNGPSTNGTLRSGTSGTKTEFSTNIIDQNSKFFEKTKMLGPPLNAVRQTSPKRHSSPHTKLTGTEKSKSSKKTSSNATTGQKASPAKRFSIENHLRTRPRLFQSMTKSNDKQNRPVGKEKHGQQNGNEKRNRPVGSGEKSQEFDVGNNGLAVNDKLNRPVVTPVDVSTKKKIFRENLAALARQLGNKVNYRHHNDNVPFINEFTDPRLSSECDVMSRSNVF